MMGCDRVRVPVSDLYGVYRSPSIPLTALSPGGGSGIYVAAKRGQASGGFISPLFLFFLLTSIFICPSFPFLSNFGVGNDGMPDAGDMLSIFIACVLSALLLLCCFLRVGNGRLGAREGG